MLKKIGTQIAKIWTNLTIRGICLVLVGFLLSTVITPSQAGKSIKTTLSSGCNSVFQNHLCSAVGLKKHSPLAKIFSQTSVPKVKKPVNTAKTQKPAQKAVSPRWTDSQPLTVGIFGSSDSRPKNRLTVETR